MIRSRRCKLNVNFWWDAKPFPSCIQLDFALFLRCVHLAFTLLYWLSENLCVYFHQSLVSYKSQSCLCWASSFLQCLYKNQSNLLEKSWRPVIDSCFEGVASTACILALCPSVVSTWPFSHLVQLSHSNTLLAVSNHCALCSYKTDAGLSRGRFAGGCYSHSMCTAAVNRAAGISSFGFAVKLIFIADCFQDDSSDHSSTVH